MRDLRTGSSKLLGKWPMRSNAIGRNGDEPAKRSRGEINAIKLTKNDSPDGQHHFIPKEWVESVDNHVHLRKNAEETLQEWKTDAASCAS
jgi:hypothetical protein